MATGNDAEWVGAAGDHLSFGTPTPADELLHGEGPAGDSLTETWFWGFNVPGASINCFAYCKVYVNLGVALSGLMVFRGVKPQHLACELFDVPAFSSAAFVGDGSDIRAPNGFRVRVIEPLQHLHMSYTDQARQTAIDVHLHAVAPPVVRANGKHFEQVMRTSGRLVLRGEHHKVDGYHVRDRSWGELRPEDHVALPPYNWVTAVTEDGSVALNVGSHDDPEKDPHWAEHFDVPAEKAFKDGWVWRGADPVRLVRASKQTERDPVTLRPRRYRIDAEDADGNLLELTGDVVGSAPWGSWHNISTHLGLVRWELDGVRAWGDTQEVQWNDYVWRYGQT